jgi:hypothetical protein
LAAARSSVSVATAEVAGETLTVITHKNPKAYSLLERGFVRLKPGEMLGPMTMGKHSEVAGISFLQALGAEGGVVGTWPLGCHACQTWMRANAPGWLHLNPKP